MEDTDRADELAKLEERFLNDLNARPVPITSILATLRYLNASNAAPLADSWARMAVDSFSGLGDQQGLVKLLSVMAGWHNERRPFAEYCRTTLKKARRDRVWDACLDSVAFGEVAVPESLRRLAFLMECKSGSLCFDKTWGFGVIRRIDDFYKRIHIDFTLRPGHALSMANAAENLVFVPEQHICAVRYRDPAAFAKMVKDAPAEVVRLALQSFGAVTVPKLAELLDQHSLVPASGWKTFWDAARKALKSDPLIDIPTKRTVPITVREAAVSFDHDWFKTLSTDRDIPSIGRRIGELEAAAEADSLDEFARSVLCDRLAFCVKGAHNTDPALYARLALAVQRLKLKSPGHGEMSSHLLDDDRFVKAAEGLSARDTTRMVAYMLEHGENTPARLLDTLPAMNYNLLSASVEALSQRPGDLAALKQRCHELLATTVVPPALLVWVLRNLDSLEGWPMPSLYELMGQAIAVIEDRTMGGERLRMQHQLLGMFEQAKWFEKAFSSLDLLQREAIFSRIHGSDHMGDAATQRALTGRMIKVEPSLSQRKQASAPVERTQILWTSWRSLRERKEQFRQLVEVEIPKNSADIAQARSYGDLSENFEYHAAKQQQAVLMSRRDQWDLDLKQARGTNFENVEPEVAGMGVEVTLEFPDGSCRTHTILGEWDSDETRGIIPLRSRLAQALQGHSAGEKVEIPGMNGSEKVTIKSISPLSEPIRVWIADNDIRRDGSGAPS